jgi:hypothetical protein
LRIKNTSTKYSYSGLSVTSGFVYLGSNDQLLGEIHFESDWDGEIEAGEEIIVRFDKVVEDAQVFQPPCDQEVYMDFILTAPDYGELESRTPTLVFSCFV